MKISKHLKTPKPHIGEIIILPLINEPRLKEIKKLQNKINEIINYINNNEKS